MNKVSWLLLVWLPCSSLNCFFEEHNPHLEIYQNLQKGDLEKSIDMYLENRKLNKKHDPLLIQRIAETILKNSLKDKNNNIKLNGVLGIQAGLVYRDFIHNLSAIFPQSDIATQMAILQMSSQTQDESFNPVLIKALSVPILSINLEALFQLCLKKNVKSIGYLNSLMHKLPRNAYYLFPVFFLTLGDKEATMQLKKLANEPYLPTRIETIIQSAQFGKTEILPTIRAHLSHTNPAEQEACAFSLGVLKDCDSIKKLKKLVSSKDESIKLSALEALNRLGDYEHLSLIRNMAEGKNLFAFHLLSEDSEDLKILENFLLDTDWQVQINACLALIDKCPEKCESTIEKILLRDSRDAAFIPVYSPGKTLSYWKAIYSSAQQQKFYDYSLSSASLTFKEKILHTLADSSEKSFLRICENIFKSNQTELVPTCIRLLEAKRSAGSIELIGAMSQKAGAPLTRHFCHLAAFRLRLPNDHEKYLTEWVEENKYFPLGQVKQKASMNPPLSHTRFNLTSDEKTLLFLEILEALVSFRKIETLDWLLKILKEGHLQNRPLIAGLLIKSLE
ncbi:MAG: HEAT repeat domain-containing protein [Rhabdochlamydiaceae bacterium]